MRKHGTRARKATMTRQSKRPKGLFQSFKDSCRSWYDSKTPVFRFGVGFAALMALFYSTWITPLGDQILSAYLAVSAKICNVILHCLGQQSEVLGTTICSAKFTTIIRRGCDAIEPSWFLTAAIICFPSPFKWKIPGIVVGVILLQVLNLIRIVSLYFIGAYFNSFFEMAHWEIWPTAFIIIELLFWICWAAWMKRIAIRE